MMGRLLRQLAGHSRREKLADEIMREYREETAPEIRAIKARAAAVERLVHQLERDAAWNSRLD